MPYMAWLFRAYMLEKVLLSLMVHIGGQRRATRHFPCPAVIGKQRDNQSHTMQDAINIGKEIHEELVRQGRSVAWLSRQLGTSRMACYRIFNSYSIDSRVLQRISKLLNHDFFALYSDTLK